jgi:small GTP-binding protein
LEEKFIDAILYTELDDIMGPNPVACIPDSLNEYDRMHISIKTITVLSGEKGLVPESLVILPFPSMQMKGLIKYIKWEDKQRRGGIGQSAITLLFKEMNDVIFYKYLEFLQDPFDSTAREVIRLEQQKADPEQYLDIINRLEDHVQKLLESFRYDETTKTKLEEFPEEDLKKSEEISYKFKLVILGDPNVGKTSLVLRFTNDAFKRTYIPTLGVHVSNKIFKVGDSLIQLVLWDIAGQQKFEVMRQQFYLGSDAIFIVFDLTNPKTYSNVASWYFDVIKLLKGTQKLPGYVIGNKKDLIDNIKIDPSDAIQLAKSLNLDYIETSALTGEHVKDAFHTIAEILYQLVRHQ